MEFTILDVIGLLCSAKPSFGAIVLVIGEAIFIPLIVHIVQGVVIGLASTLECPAALGLSTAAIDQLP